MLERYYVRPGTVDQVRSSWIGEAIEKYVVDLAERGYVSLDTTNRYAELTLRAKEAAVRACEPEWDTSAGARRGSIWKDDETLLAWLNAL